jgi:Rrf2 family protein
MLSILEQMITKTTMSAIRALMFVAQNSAEGCLSPRRIAEALGESPTYLAKVSRSLVKAGILRAEKGVKGGVWLGRAPRDITLLAVVEACQGTVLGDYCRGDREPENVCGYHRAAVELQDAIVGVLSRWNLAQLLRRPQGLPVKRGVPCFVRVDSMPAKAGTR